MHVAPALLLRRVAVVALLLAISARASRAGDCSTLVCDDGNACNGVETCEPATGECVAGVPPDCDDGDDCTLDTCVPATGCMQTPVPSSLGCRGRTLAESLEAADQVIRTTSPGALGGVAAARRLQRLLADAITVLHLPECPQGRRCRSISCRCYTNPRRAIRRVRRDLILYCGAVQSGRGNGRIESSLGAELLAPCVFLNPPLVRDIAH